MSLNAQQEERLRQIESDISDLQTSHALLAQSSAQLAKSIESLNSTVLELIKVVERTKGAVKALFLVGTVLGTGITLISQYIFGKHKGE